MRSACVADFGIDGWIDDEQRLGRRCSDPKSACLDRVGV